MNDITILPPLAQVEHIQCYVPNENTTRTLSVMEVKTESDLLDPRLGISDITKTCATCNSTWSECPGHMGHLELPIPIYSVFYVKHLTKLLNSICFYCQTLRFPKTDPRYATIRLLPPNERRERVMEICNQFKRCGRRRTLDELRNPENSGDICRGDCGKTYITFKNEDRLSTFIQGTITLEKYEYMLYQEDPNWKPFSLGPEEIYQVLQLLDDETKYMLGYGEFNDPIGYMWNPLPISSINTRPCQVLSGFGNKKSNSFSDWTKFYKTIIKAVTKLRESMETSSDRVNCTYYKFNDIISKSFKRCFINGMLEKSERKIMKKQIKAEEKLDKLEGLVAENWRRVVEVCSAFASFSHMKLIQKGNKFGKPPSNVEVRFKNQKKGQFRGNIIGKRVNVANGRMVLEMSIFMRPGQCGFPRKAAMGVTYKDIVTPYNVSRVQTWILNGPYTYPGANSVIMKNGDDIDLTYHENRRDIDVRDVLYVRRHILEGDTIIVGRQPTLHQMSQFALEVTITDENVIRLHCSIFPPMAADCDGDELYFYFVQNIESIAELKELASVKSDIMKDGKVWVKFIQNACSGLMLLSEETSIDKDEASHLVGIWDNLPEPYTVGDDPTNPEPLWTGRQIIESIFPKNFTCIVKKVGNHVEIRNGKFISGVLNENILNGKRGILECMCKDYSDKQLVIDFIYKGYIIAQNFLDHFGLSVGYFDCAIDKNDVRSYESGDLEESDPLLHSIMGRMAKVKENVTKLCAYVDKFKNHYPSVNLALEENIRSHIDKIIKMSTDTVVKYHEHVDKTGSNGLLTIIRSGVKTKNILNQMCGVIGQMYVLRQRYTPISSSFTNDERKLFSHGFIDSNYSDGLSLDQVVSEAHATTEAVIRKNRGTAKSGYSVRKQTTCMMGLVVDYKGRVLDVNNRVVWERYGGDGYDPKKLTMSKLRLLTFKEWDIIRRYAIIFSMIDINTVSTGTFKSSWSKAKRGKGPISQEWIKTLAINGTFYDQSSSLESSMNDDALARWKSISTKNFVLYKLSSEIKLLVELRNKLTDLLSRVHHSTDILQFKTPFSFEHLFERCVSIIPVDDKVDMNPFEYSQVMTDMWSDLVKKKLVQVDNLNLKCLFYDWLSTRSIMLKWKFGSKHLKWLKFEIQSYLVRSLIQRGESVGVIASQNMGEPHTQESLKTTHHAGKRNLEDGTSRVASLIDGLFKFPSMQIVLKKKISTRIEAQMFGLEITRCFFYEISNSYPSYVFSNDGCMFSFHIDMKKCIERMVILRQAVKMLSTHINLQLTFFKVPFMDQEETESWDIHMFVPFKHPFWRYTTSLMKKTMPRKKENIADNIAYNVHRKVVIHGIGDIESFYVEEIYVRNLQGKSNRWCVGTIGSNLYSVLRLPQVDSKRTTSNDSTEMCKVFGIHAAEKSLQNEFTFVMPSVADNRHIKLVAKFMTSDSAVKSMKVQYMGQSIPPLQRASFEYGVKQMASYCAKGEIDTARTVCGASISNKLMQVGTGYNLDILPDLNAVIPEQVERVRHVCKYVFSPKVDGKRFWFVLFKNRKGKKLCALVDRNFEIHHFPQRYYNCLPDTFFSGTILDGDLTLVKGTDKYCFCIYDCITISGNFSNVLRYDQRLELCREVLYQLLIGSISGSVDDVKNQLASNATPIEFGQGKPYIISSLREEMSVNMYKVGNIPFLMVVKPIFSTVGIVNFDKTMNGKLSFDTDGYVLTHLEDVCHPFRIKKTSFIKWKPRTLEYSENTVEFVVAQNNEKLQPIKNYFFQNRQGGSQARNPWSYDLNMGQVDAFRQNDSGKKYVLWTLLPSGNTTGKMMCFSTCDALIDVEPNNVYECRWNYKKVTWEVIRPRNKSPNNWDTVIGTIQNIVEDIQIDELLPASE